MADSLRATAYWTLAPGHGALREEDLRPPGPDEVLVRALHSGISRGTELLVHRGRVPTEVATQMRAPHQAGEFPGPVKYGYLSVGVVEQGPDDVAGRTVFCLFPHQDRYVVPATSVTVIPDGVPARRAVLTGTVETALNAVWDAAPRMGDRIAVVGAGMVGCAVTALLQRFPLDRLELVDVDPTRAPVAGALGADFAEPASAKDGCDLVVHTSATSTGLRRSLELLGEEGEVIELSWYGADEVTLPLGSVFHPRRLAVRSSQVSQVSAARRVRRSHADRRAIALEQLLDARFDVLITGTGPFGELPETMRRLDSGELPALCHVVDY